MIVFSSALASVCTVNYMDKYYTDEVLDNTNQSCYSGLLVFLFSSYTLSYSQTTP
eukprot:SAG22_NODE_626_length_8433_cov_43.291097_6_plen_55_part_00